MFFLFFRINCTYLIVHIPVSVHFLSYVSKTLTSSASGLPSFLQAQQESEESSLAAEEGPLYGCWPHQGFEFRLIVLLFHT